MALVRRGHGDARRARWCSTRAIADTSIDALAAGDGRPPACTIGRRCERRRAQPGRGAAAGAEALRGATRSACRAWHGVSLALRARRDRRHRRRVGQRPERTARRAVGPAACPAQGALRRRRRALHARALAATRAGARRCAGPCARRPPRTRRWCCRFAAWESAVLGYQGAPALQPPRLAAPRRDARRLRADDGALRRAAARRRPALRPSSPAATSRSWCWRAKLRPEPQVLLVGQPTRGVDIGAIEFIHGRLRAMRDAGGAVLVVSSELDEILALADRVLVMNARAHRRRAADRAMHRGGAGAADGRARQRCAPHERSAQGDMPALGRPAWLPAAVNLRARAVAGPRRSWCCAGRPEPGPGAGAAGQGRLRQRAPA